MKPPRGKRGAFIATIQTFLPVGSRPKRKTSGGGSVPFLYPTNAQSGWSRRRCAATTSSYTMVAVLASTSAQKSGPARYLRLIRNPHDSNGLAAGDQHANPRIGKTPLSTTLERLALETGASTWDGAQRRHPERLSPSRPHGDRNPSANSSSTPGHDGSRFCQERLSADVPPGRNPARADTGFGLLALIQTFADRKWALGFQLPPTSDFESTPEEAATYEHPKAAPFANPCDAATLPN